MQINFTNIKLANKLTYMSIFCKSNNIFDTHKKIYLFFCIFEKNLKLILCYLMK